MIVDALKTLRSVWRKKDKLLCHNCSFECSLSSPSQLMSANLHQAACCNEWIWEVWRWKWISPTCTWWDVISRPSGGCCVPGKLLISQCFICTLIALFQFHDLLITICFQHWSPVYLKHIPTKGKERMISQTERNWRAIFPPILWSVRSKRYTSFRRAVMCVLWEIDFALRVKITSTSNASLTPT